MNTLYSATKINSISDSAIVLIDGEYKGQAMEISALRDLLKSTSDTVVWVYKVLVKGAVVEKSLEFSREHLNEFAAKYLRQDVLKQITPEEFAGSLRK